MTKTKLQKKVKGLYDKIGTELYSCRDDFEASGERYNSALIRRYNKGFRGKLK